MMTSSVLYIVLIVLAVLMIAALIKAVLGPKFTDRIVSVNCISTMVIVFIVILSFYMKAPYLIDVAIIYALLGFTANLVLTRILLRKDTAGEKDAAPAGEEKKSKIKQKTGKSHRGTGAKMPRGKRKS